ncbi:hypothetical protein [Mycobacterium sp.]
MRDLYSPSPCTVDEAVDRDVPVKIEASIVHSRAVAALLEASR